MKIFRSLLKRVVVVLQWKLFFLSITPFIFLLLIFELNVNSCEMRKQKQLIFRQYFSFIKVSNGSNHQLCMKHTD